MSAADSEVRRADPSDDQGDAYSASQSLSESSWTSQSSSRTLRTSGSGTGAWNTPMPTVSMCETSGQTYGFTNKKTEERYIRLAQEASTWLLGPMPPTDFLDAFLHRMDVSTERRPSSEKAFARIPENAKKEKDIYQPLAEALNSTPAYTSIASIQRCPGFSFHVTAEDADESGPGEKLGSAKPDICCFADKHLARVPHPLRDRTRKRAHMGFAALFFEIKASRNHDFFRDPPKRTNSENRKDWRFVQNEDENSRRMHDLGQAVSYAVETCKRQHRLFCFSVSISGNRARFIRWDRAGAVVSESFNLHEQPELLCDFLWCFSQLSDAERGYDLTVEPADPTQERAFRDAIKRHIETQYPADTSEDELQQALNDHFEADAVTAIHLPYFSGSDDKRFLLVSRPVAVPLSVVGRCTRTYWAYDPHLDQVFFLKDTWRCHWYEHEDPFIKAEREGDVLLALKEKNVRNIPQLDHHEDVPEVIAPSLNESTEPVAAGTTLITYGDEPQITQTQHFLSADWVCGTDIQTLWIIERTHYRLTLNVVGYSLLRIRGTAELLNAAYDAFLALMDAYQQAGRLHRDITPGHIVLYQDPRSASTHTRNTGIRRGYLVDWDLSMNTAKGYKHRDLPIPATWQFLSAELCFSLIQLNHVSPSLRLRRSHIVQDDMESIIYVVLYCGLLRLPHQLPSKSLRDLLTTFFDACETQDAIPSGGHAKYANMSTFRTTSTISWQTSGMKRWIRTMLDFACPLSEVTPQKYHGKWNLVDVEQWWRKFLVHKGRKLETNNVVDNLEADWKRQFQNSAPDVVRNRPHQGTHASSSVSTVVPEKRQSDQDRAEQYSNNDELNNVQPKRLRLHLHTTGGRGSSASTQSAQGSDMTMLSVYSRPITRGHSSGASAHSRGSAYHHPSSSGDYSDSSDSNSDDWNDDVSAGTATATSL